MSQSTVTPKLSYFAKERDHRPTLIKKAKPDDLDLTLLKERRPTCHNKPSDGSKPSIDQLSQSDQRFGINITDVDLLSTNDDEDPTEVDLISKDALVNLFGQEWVENASKQALVESNADPTTRSSRVLTDEETEDALYGNPFMDSKNESEIQAYVDDMIRTLTTGDETEDFKSISMYAKLISRQQGTK